jgi:hypothetical protein
MREAVYRAAERHFASIHGQDKMEIYISPERATAAAQCNLRPNSAGIVFPVSRMDVSSWWASIQSAADDE